MASLVAGETLRLLLVATHEAVRDEIVEALAGRAGDHRLHWISQPDLALIRAQDLTPHVILIDDEIDGAVIVDLVTQLTTALPEAAVLILVGPEALAVARQAVLAGALGFLTKPLDADELLSAMRQVLTRHSMAGEPAGAGEPVGRVIIFCAPKGGTGRTTLAINVAISLGWVEKAPVVLVDADYSAPAIDVALNLRGERDISDLRPKMSQLDRDLVTSVLAHHESGLDVLLAPPPADLTTPFSLPQVQRVLVWLKRMFPWVIVDLGLPLDETAFAFLDSSDLVCMSVLPEMVGLRNARLMFDELVARGYPEDKLWLILNRDGLPGGIPLAVLEERLGRKIKWRIPNDQEMATDTVNRGVPFVMNHRRSAVSRACLGLSAELVRALGSEGEAMMPITAKTPMPVTGQPSKAPAIRKLVLVPAVAIALILLLARVVFPMVQASRTSAQQTAGLSSATPAAVIAAVVATTPPAAGLTPAGTPMGGDVSQTEELTPVAVTLPPSPEASLSPAPGAAITQDALAASPTGTDTPTPSPSPTATMTWTATPSASSTPTATAVPTLTSTPPPSPTATRLPRQPTATQVRRQLPSPTPVPVALSLLEPAPRETKGGKVLFRWQSAAPLRPGTAYEVVMWNSGEDPASARGVAATTADTSLTADLDAVYNLGLIKVGEAFWTVLIVQTNPYIRLTQPAASNARTLMYQPEAPSEPGGGIPPPPKP